MALTVRPRSQATCPSPPPEPFPPGNSSLIVCISAGKKHLQYKAQNKSQKDKGLLSTPRFVRFFKMSHSQTNQQGNLPTLRSRLGRRRFLIQIKPLPTANQRKNVGAKQNKVEQKSKPKKTDTDRAAQPRSKKAKKSKIAFRSAWASSHL